MSNPAWAVYKDTNADSLGFWVLLCRLTAIRERGSETSMGLSFPEQLSSAEQPAG